MDSLVKNIKNYLEKQIKEDTALAVAYNEKKLPDCIKYIMSKARKMLTGNCGWIDDAIVYKWARDFFYDILPSKKVHNEGKIRSIPSKNKKTKKLTEKEIFELSDMCLFSSLPEEDRGGFHA